MLTHEQLHYTSSTLTLTELALNLGQVAAIF